MMTIAFRSFSRREGPFWPVRPNHRPIFESKGISYELREDQVSETIPRHKFAFCSSASSPPRTTDLTNRPEVRQNSPSQGIQFSLAIFCELQEAEPLAGLESTPRGHEPQNAGQNGHYPPCFPSPFLRR